MTHFAPTPKECADIAAFFFGRELPRILRIGCANYLRLPDTVAMYLAQIKDGTISPIVAHNAYSHLLTIKDAL